MQNENFKRVFYRHSRQAYAKTAGIGKNKKEEINLVKESTEGGCFYEFSIVWYPFPKGDAARVEMFDDSFVAFEEEKELFQRLSKLKNPTPDEVHLLLLEIGYEDASDNKEVPKKCRR